MLMIRLWAITVQYACMVACYSSLLICEYKYTEYVFVYSALLFIIRGIIFVYSLLFSTSLVFFFSSFFSVKKKQNGRSVCHYAQAKNEKEKYKRKKYKKKWMNSVTNQSRCKAYLLCKWLSKNKYLCRTHFLLFHFIFTIIKNNNLQQQQQKCSIDTQILFN